MSDLAELLEIGWTTCYETRFKGRTVITTWGKYHGLCRDDDDESPPVDAGPALGRTHRFEFRQEIDLDATSQGRGRSRMVYNLRCAPDYRPLRYDFAGVSISFADGKFLARLPEGSELTGDDGDAGFLLGPNMAPQLAIEVRLLLSRSEPPFHTCLFSPDGLEAVPYHLTGDRRTLHSSLGDEISVGDDGWITEIRLPAKEYSVVRVDRRFPRWRKQDPRAAAVPPYETPEELPIRSVDLRIAGPAVEIGATLTVPKETRRAAALFLGGSGSHDRHGISGGVDLGYHSLLDGLGAEGVVNLRFDTRGAGDTRFGSDLLDAGFDRVVEDSRAALEALLERPEASGVPWFLIGHSQGGLVALILAREVREPRGLVLLATAGRPIDEVIEDQIRDQAQKVGFSAETLDRQIDHHRTFFRCVREVEEWTPDTVPAAVYADRSGLRWHRELLAKDPLELIRGLRCPVLIVQGDRDFQIAVKDSQLLEDAARQGGVPVERVVLAGCDHLFKRVGKTEGLRSYFDRRRRVSTELGDLLKGWIASAASSRPREG